MGLIDSWLIKLSQGHSDAAWDQFVERYRRLIFAMIRHLTADCHDVMDFFLWVCEALRETAA